MLQSIVQALQDNAVLLGLLVGSVTPLLTSVVQQPKWSKNVRIGVSVVVSVVIGFALAAADGKLDAASLFQLVIAVLVSAEAFYQKLWKAVGATQAIEGATSLSARKTGDDEFEAFYEDPYSDGSSDEPKGLEYK